MKKLKLQKNAGFTLLNPAKWERQSRYLTGFTLLEMIVAIGVFIVVVTVSLSAFLNVHDIQLKMSAFRAANDSLNFVVEAMAREIREGDTSTYVCGGVVCADGAYDKIEFKTIDTSETVEYELDAPMIKRNGKEFTPASVTINDSSSFTVRGFGLFSGGDYQQPLVIITIQGEAGPSKEKLKSKVNIQTTVSLRQLDIDI